MEPFRIRLDGETAERVRQLAQEEDRPIAVMLRRLVMESLRARTTAAARRDLRKARG